ncbi:MAG: hypothetical protein O3A46_03560 [Candidatus Poribacteria bacterium]|nr:hypothetical protein [Candidatus Poribacteria bacterium]
MTIQDALTTLTQYKWQFDLDGTSNFFDVTFNSDGTATITDGPWSPQTKWYWSWQDTVWPYIVILYANPGGSADGSNLAIYVMTLAGGAQTNGWYNKMGPANGQIGTVGTFVAMYES